MRELVLTISFGLLVSVTHGQVTDIRSNFINQQILEIRTNAAKATKWLIIEDTPQTWDTTSLVFKRFLSQVDTTRIDSLTGGNIPMKKKIIKVMSLFDSLDYRIFRQQINSQATDSFIDSQKFKGNKGTRNKLTVKLTQPLVDVEGITIIAGQFMRSDSGGYSFIVRLYKLVGDKWILFETLDRQVLNY